MAKTSKSNCNPALKDLEMLEGAWEMELSNAAFLPDPKTTVKGDVSFEWVENGAFLCLRMGMGGDAIWLMNRDESEKGYKIFYYDSREVSRVYEMSFSKDTWKIWRSSPGFSQRFAGKISKDGKSIHAYWEHSSDGKKWEHDFDVLYTKK